MGGTESEEAIRAELLTGERLLQHARSIAASEEVARTPRWTSVGARIREANLERHLETNKPGAAAAEPAKGAAPAAAPAKPGDANKSEAMPPLPRFEFGAADDFQLQQAMNHLKGQPVIASTKAVAAANTAVPAAKP